MQVVLNKTCYTSPLDEISCSNDDVNVFEKLDSFIKKHQGKHIVCFLSYELKNHIENLESSNIDNIDFPLLYCFVPGVIKTNYEIKEKIKDKIDTLKFQVRESKQTYIKKIDEIKNHIQLGNFYETNYCYEWWTECLNFNSKNVYKKLISYTNPPYRFYADLENHQILCASPELFIQKRGNKLISKPIKGTQKRSTNKLEDKNLISELENNPKEKAENVMIVDLVRNDFSKISNPESVKVEELCKVYTFKNIHQMISTISCTIKDSTKFSSILKATFPMGSMTGAPKVRVLKTMEKLENTKRGLYSGSVGIIHPNGDFDFNVIIRTLLYNKRNKILSFHVGGAITSNSIPEKEYEETLLKAEALFNACK